MKLLLINPRSPESFWSFNWIGKKIFRNHGVTNPPLGLATLAALCPDGWQVQIVDEAIEAIPLSPDADIIGVCGMGVQFERQKELLTYYRSRGYYVVAGGSYASLCPEVYEELADTVVAGEAEYTWPQFCRDFEEGAPKPLYKEEGIVNLADSPTPRFDLLQLKKYRAVSMQFSRGCPFQCDFCDIIVMFGRKPRTKTLPQIGKELDLLRKHNIHNVFFVDDNLIGNKAKAKELLRYLHHYQKSHRYWFNFGTEASLNMAQDDELLSLFRQANFDWVFLGIESPDVTSLKQIRKFQNTRGDILDSVRKIYSYGIDIYGGFIIGFDNDTKEIFDRQYQFILESGIQAAMVGLLTAVPKTPLYEKLKAEDRLLPDPNHTDNTKLATNFLPKRMSYSELISGYRQLYYRLLDQKNIAIRIRNKLRYFSRPFSHSQGVSLIYLRALKNFIISGLLPGGFSRILQFLRTIPLFRPALIPLAVQDWIIGLSMRDYVQRNFFLEFEKSNQKVQEYLKMFEQTFRGYIRQGALELSIERVKNAAAALTVYLKGDVDRDFFKEAAKALELVLKNTAASVTLRFEKIQDTHLKSYNRLLKRLSRYGDRISIALNQEWERLADLNVTSFHVILNGAGAS